MRKKSILAATFLGGAALLVSFRPADNERYFEIAKNLDIFATLFKEVNTYYVDEVPPAKLVKTGIDAMLRSLDPYTNYIAEDDIEDFRTMTTGQYGGIGAVVSKRNGKTVVQAAYEGYPAQKAGLLPGDEILNINGVVVDKKSNADVSKLLKGQANSVVKLLVTRYGQEAPVEINITRDKIQVDNVPYYGMLTPEIGYFQLSGFTVDAGKEVRLAVSKLKEQGAKKLIFDIRDNPGGLLNEAVNISNLFVDKGRDIVSTKGKVADWNKTYKALDMPLDTQIPMVVITSNRSASASEIVSGVLQDYDRAVLVGERTFGKGLVQATRPLSYNSQLKVTTAKYYIPSGRCIQEIDYTHRADDGTLGKVPDSLRTAFKTQAGRAVYDGGGVAPDVAVQEREIADITRVLLQKSYLFDYATRYRAQHPSIASARQFKLTDTDYQQFVDYLKGKDINYETETEKALTSLTKKLKAEKHYDDVKTELEATRRKVTTNKANDLTRFKPEIRELLEQEIVSRYYFQKGSIEATFDDDPNILTALAVLGDQSRYTALLRTGTEEAKTRPEAKRNGNGSGSGGR
ncbi:S41 family peptidase [Hymenobacter psychrophilus]|uniref:C-terminal processing peptidase-3. Serine peptidase. MEROPS family S41A n=1 Tax=Hymenobacter psychrophilus TaxID=651662 RepID=A0A1H3NQV5_9BACT|nr:S41 family peptidase [Hymenobacter psychrophilus]SDY91297.1 C-terminal processing peptidase-3. Serine peptidase. MEROPS family S41A [Hymenobacter psychrophilus]